MYNELEAVGDDERWDCNSSSLQELNVSVLLSVLILAADLVLLILVNKNQIHAFLIVKSWKHFEADTIFVLYSDQLVEKSVLTCLL